MKSFSIVILTLMTFSFAFTNDELSPEDVVFETHPDIKLNHASISEKGEDELIVSGMVQYKKLRGSLHGHLDLLVQDAMNNIQVLGSSGKLSTYRGLMGYKTRYFRIRIVKPAESDTPLTLRFHENNVRPHSCEC